MISQPTPVRKSCCGCFPGRSWWALQFGVVLVDGVEIATFRSDHSYADGRHPGRVVFETDPKQDVLRRDFTINALLLDPLRIEFPVFPVFPVLSSGG